MPITALPQDTARAIGSTSVISDPCSVVKELLDNALDASATSVFIEISQNTVDVIQVKDNGRGIPPSDHALVCRRAHTSKIATVEDLKKIGGSSLGFRGEALASTAEVSGGVTVTTRVETEPVASVIKYGRDGGVTSVQRASHPVGTTVRVSDLFKHIPVRRQTTLRNTTKNLARVKRLIQEYAAAQPSKRLSLKVLKAKNENGNWMYAPKPNASLMDAALKIAGTDVASTCVLKHWPFTEATSEPPYMGSELDCRMTALVLDPNADPAKAGNIGQYISIDGRPISASRGIGKNIAKVYKSYVRSAIAAKDSSTTVTDPFLCLHVHCDEAMYDVNIEPAKDDVLFEDTSSILEAIEELCRNVYGDKEGGTEKGSTSVKGKQPIRQRDGFELLLASSQSTSQGQQRSPDAGEAGNRRPSPVARSTPQPSSRRMEGLSDDQRRYSDIRTYSSDRESLNPWNITKIITPFNRTGPAATDTSARRLSMERPGPASGHHLSPEAASRRSSVASCLPSPSASNSCPTSNSPPGVSSPRTTFPISQTSPSLRTNYAKRAARERDRERYGNGSLDTWFGKTTQVALSRITTEDPSSPEEEEQPLTRLAQERFGSATQPSPTQSTPAGRSYDVEDGPSRIPHSPLSTRSQYSASEVPNARPEPGWKRLDQWSSRLHELSQPNATPGLAEALDFENRKREAIQMRREQIRKRHEQSTPTSSPHLNRYLAARAALSEARPDGGQSGAAMNPHDPRAYLMRYRTNQENDKMTEGERPRRINTNKLPFENISNGSLHKTGLVQTQDMAAFAASFSQTSRVDLYTESGCQYEALIAEVEPDIINIWSSRLSGLIRTQYTDEQGSMVHNLQFDFSSIQ